MISVWRDMGYLNKEKFKIIQERIDVAIVPSNIGAFTVQNKQWI